MKDWSNPLRVALALAFLSLFLLHRTPQQPGFHLLAANSPDRMDTEREADKAAFTRQRLLHEFKMLRNPVTGTIPRNIHELEWRTAQRIPDRQGITDPAIARILSNEQVQVQNNYVSVGPVNIAGRSRTLAFDSRNRQIMLTGGVTGGIFRSTDGGANWTFASPVDDIRSVTSIVQDPTNQNVWYCGTGEVYSAASVQEISLPGTVGHGIFKSTDNGASWSKLAATADSDPYNFNGSFDLVHRLAVHPTTGHVYAAVHNRIMRSTDGGQNWQSVMTAAIGNTALAGITEVYINPANGRIYAAFSGENDDPGIVGVWESATGALNGWTRIAGGIPGQPGGVTGWRSFGQWGRVVLTASTTNRLLVLYKNNNSASAGFPEADLFRCDLSSGNPATYTWQNLNDYVPNEPIGRIEGINPYTTQFNGFNMSIAVKPDQDHILFIGGTVLHRVNLLETDPALKFRRIGGYGVGIFPNEVYYPNHHPDIHAVYFPPGNPLELYTASDGGIHRTTNNLAETVGWESLNRSFQSLQYQNISLINDINYDWVIGGSQDNGTLVSLDPVRTREHFQVTSGDGASTAMSSFYKTGNTWMQYLYSSIPNGTLLRRTLTWQYNPTTNQLTNTQNVSEDVTPFGLSQTGQWLTLFTLDPGIPEQLYYNINNRLFRTLQASAVNSGSWTEITGVRATVPDSATLTSMALSLNSGSKTLFFGTDAGKVYRLNNANTVTALGAPVDITPSTMLAGSYVAGIAVNPRNADTVLAVVSNYDVSSQAVVRNIFWTGNATAAQPAWQVLDGVLEPLSVQSCAIVVKPTGVEYYAGTSVGLYSTTAIRGASTAWVKEGDGMMKNAVIRSLFLRPADNKLAVGTHGNGGFLGAVNITTGVPGTVNDPNFITLVYPTLSRGDVYFRVGQLPSVFQVNCRVFNLNGQLVYQKNLPYQHGLLQVPHLAAGNYVLLIASPDNQHRFITRFNKY